MRYKEVKGNWPLTKPKQGPLQESQESKTSIGSSSQLGESGIFLKGDDNMIERTLSITEVS